MKRVLDEKSDLARVLAESADAIKAIVDKVFEIIMVKMSEEEQEKLSLKEGELKTKLEENIKDTFTNDYEHFKGSHTFLSAGLSEFLLEILSEYGFKNVYLPEMDFSIKIIEDDYVLSLILDYKIEFIYEDGKLIPYKNEIKYPKPFTKEEEQSLSEILKKLEIKWKYKTK